jgi:hypothetical protein
MFPAGNFLRLGPLFEHRSKSIAFQCRFQPNSLIRIILSEASCDRGLRNAWAPIECSIVQPRITRITRMEEKLHSRKICIQLFQSISAALPPAYDEHSHSCHSCDSWFTLPRPPGSQCNQPLEPSTISLVLAQACIKLAIFAAVPHWDRPAITRSAGVDVDFTNRWPPPLRITAWLWRSALTFATVSQ